MQQLRAAVARVYCTPRERHNRTFNQPL